MTDKQKQPFKLKLGNSDELYKRLNPQRDMENKTGNTKIKGEKETKMTNKQTPEDIRAEMHAENTAIIGSDEERRSNAYMAEQLIHRAHREEKNKLRFGKGANLKKLTEKVEAA